MICLLMCLLINYNKLLMLLYLYITDITDNIADNITDNITDICNDVVLCLFFEVVPESAHHGSAAVAGLARELRGGRLSSWPSSAAAAALRSATGERLERLER